MAQKPDGKSAKTERVAFTKPAAERIARVVRAVELGDRDSAGLTFGTRAVPPKSKVFRICTYTGSWSVGATKSVAFKYQTSTPNTASATNLFFPVTTTAAGDCAIAKDGTAWYLIDVPFYTASAVFITSITVSATLNTTTCDIAVATTAALATINYIKIGVP